jgi:hypothetical protein
MEIAGVVRHPPGSAGAGESQGQTGRGNDQSRGKTYREEAPPTGNVIGWHQVLSAPPIKA